MEKIISIINMVNMRLKVDIQKYDDERVLILFRDGLGEVYINAINDLASKEEWRDVAFATLDDDRIALVCRPVTGAKIFDWDARKNKVKYPEKFVNDFLRKAHQALHEDDLQLYTESLNKDEEELKKVFLEEALKSREKKDKKQDEKEDKSWEETK